jgi:hypothetical protein
VAIQADYLFHHRTDGWSPRIKDKAGTVVQGGVMGEGLKRAIAAAKATRKPKQEPYA